MRGPGSGECVLRYGFTSGLHPFRRFQDDRRQHLPASFVILGGWPEAAAGRCFQRAVEPGGPAVAPGGRGSTSPRVSFLVAGLVSGWSAGGEGLQPGDRGSYLPGPGPAGGEAEPQAAAAADETPGAGEDPQPQPFRFPPAGRAVQGEHRHPGQQLAGQGDDLAPDLVLGEAVQGEVAQPGVLGAADPVLTPCPAPVTEFQVSELAAFGAGGEGGEPVPVDVGEPQLRAGVGAFFADDHPVPLQNSPQVL